MSGVSPSKPDPEEFERFIGALLDGAPEDYQPWLFKCGKESKAPGVPEGESWKDEKHQLTPEEAVKWLEEGGNIGISGMPDDPLVNVDIDDTEETDPDDLKPTLTARSRSREGVHGFYWSVDGEHIPNIVTDEKGEVRSQGLYVVAPGSYVPTDPEDVPDGQEDYAGLYTVENEREPAEITREELPAVFNKRLTKNQALSNLADAEEEEEEDDRRKKPDGKSAVFDVTAQDIVAKEGGSTTPSDRWGSVFHGTTSGENMSFRYGLLHCWRHLVSINGYQALVALSDHTAGCNDVGSPLDIEGEGEGSETPSCVFGDDSAIWYAWKYAKENKYIPEDDPVPYRAIKHICRARELCPPTDLPDGYDPENGETIPRRAYNGAIESIREYDGLDPGRERVEPENGRGNGGEESESETVSDSWGTVRALFRSQESDSSSEAYNLAAGMLNAEYSFATIRESEILYFYESEQGHYVRKGETYLRQILDDRLGDTANKTRIDEIIARVADSNVVDGDEFRPPKGKVNVENGVLDLDSRKIEPHSPDYGFTTKINAVWPEGGVPDPDGLEKWEEAIRAAVESDAEANKIEEFMGYCLEAWHHEQEKNMFFVGYRATGKSTIQESIEALFGGYPTVSNLTPQQIADTQFDAVALRDAQLNTVNDINATKVKDTGTLKRAFSGERMKLEAKYKNPEFRAPNAKHLFTANWLPHIVGLDESLFRRLLIVEFTNKIKPEDKDPAYKKRLKEADVRQAMLVRAVMGRDRLHEQEGFTNDRDNAGTRRLWDKWQDSHKLFLYSQFEITGDREDKVEKKSYWRAYEEFCGREGFEAKSHGAISKSLSYVPRLFVSSDSDYYHGLTWKGERGQQTIPQKDRVEAVYQLVGDLQANGEAVPVERVIGAAQAKGVEPDKAKHEIENMLSDGRLDEPADGKVLQT